MQFNISSFISYLIVCFDWLFYINLFVPLSAKVLFMFMFKANIAYYVCILSSLLYYSYILCIVHAINLSI